MCLIITVFSCLARLFEYLQAHLLISPVNFHRTPLIMNDVGYKKYHAVQG